MPFPSILPHPYYQSSGGHGDVYFFFVSAIKVWPFNRLHSPNFRSVLYRRRYLSKDNADNVYLTKYLRDIDEKRTEANKECILPLHWKEGSRYIDTGTAKVFDSIYFC